MICLQTFFLLVVSFPALSLASFFTYYLSIARLCGVGNYYKKEPTTAAHTIQAERTL